MGRGGKVAIWEKIIGYPFLIVAFYLGMPFEKEFNAAADGECSDEMTNERI